MKCNTALRALVMASTLCLTACASGPEQDLPVKAEPKWDVATEDEVAAALDREVAKAAKEFVQLKKDGVLMFCKRYRQVGSNIRTLQCITEAELRIRVQNMTKYRDDMRQRSGRCTHSVGCLSGS